MNIFGQMYRQGVILNNINSKITQELILSILEDGSDFQNLQIELETRKSYKKNIHKQMNQHNNQLTALCKECNLFFSCEAFNGFCSSCYRKNESLQLENQPDQQQPQPRVKSRICRVKFVRQINGKEFEVSSKLQRVQVDRSKCFACNKKLGLLGVECKCTFVFCNTHRLPEDHHCEINYQNEGKKKLQSELVKMGNQKIMDI